MSLTRKQKRRGASITSLIDVIFLLLLFFMLASTFSKQAEIELVASAEGPADNYQPSIIRLLVSPESLQLNGRPTPEAALISSVSEELSEPNSIIAIEPSDDVTTQRLIDILLLTRAIPNARIHVVEPS